MNVYWAVYKKTNTNYMYTNSYRSLREAYIESMVWLTCGQDVKIVSLSGDTVIKHKGSK